MKALLLLALLTSCAHGVSGKSAGSAVNDCADHGESSMCGTQKHVVTMEPR